MPRQSSGKTALQQIIEKENGGTDIEALLISRVYLQEKTYAEIADEWEISPGTVQAWLSKKDMNRVQSARRYWRENLPKIVEGVSVVRAG